MKFSRLILSTIVFMLLIGIKTLYAQTIITTKIETFASKDSFEKAYLQFDKPYYAAGDTIYFKAYVTIGERHNLSALSGVLHVDLINTKSKIDKSIKLPIANGVTWGDFALSDSLPTGNYRVRAYTNWMRNEGEGAFFEKIIPVGSTRQQRIPESNTAKLERGKADLQFFPEGGELVADIPNKVAFKALNNKGTGIGASGILIDNNGKTVASFTAAHLGMGYFVFTPQRGENYKAEVTYADGAKDEVPLPTVNGTGLHLSVNNDSLQKVSVKIEANKSYYDTNKGEDYTLLILSGGIATSVKCKLDSPVITLDIVKRRLFTGVTRITLFSPDNLPLCERLVFIQKFDQLNLDVSTGKPAYKTRELTTIKLNARTRTDSATAGHFSVSVTDESKVPVDENNETTILTSLLLTSDLKGSIEQPNYYFTDITAEKLKDLDLVMLTHGYRHFAWKQVLNSHSDTAKYQVETGLSINGKVTNLFGKPLPKAAVALIPVEYKGLITDTTDVKGEFHFNNLSFTDSVKFVLEAVNKKGKNTTRLIFDKGKPFPVLNQVETSPFFLNPDLGAYIINARKQQDADIKYRLSKTKLLNEVKITAKKGPLVTITKYGIADQVISGDKILYGGSLSVRLQGLIHLRQHFKKPVMVVWNGVEMPRNFNIDDINTGSIESIEVITDAIGIDYDNILIINTNFGLQVRDMVATGILPIAVQGYYKAREFYSPKYESNTTSPHLDLRSTIYWNPAVVTDKNGNASFNFYNAGTPGNYRVVIEGMDNKGNIGRKVVDLRID
jgi:hypothetical protein